jgi:hypothetical protein
MLNAAYGMLAMLQVKFWVAGYAMVSDDRRSASSLAEPASRTIDTDTQVRRAGNGELATMIQRLRAKRSQKRREQREFKAWLQITASPLW